jgi:hypothetical protein
MACLNPPLVRKPSKGFAWQCAFCTRQEALADSSNHPEAANQKNKSDLKKRQTRTTRSQLSKQQQQQQQQQQTPSPSSQEQQSSSSEQASSSNTSMIKLKVNNLKKLNSKYLRKSKTFSYLSFFYRWGNQNDKYVAIQILWCKHKHGRHPR